MLHSHNSQKFKYFKPSKTNFHVTFLTNLLHQFFFQIHLINKSKLNDIKINKTSLLKKRISEFQPHQSKVKANHSLPFKK